MAESTKKSYGAYIAAAIIVVILATVLAIATLNPSIITGIGGGSSSPTTIITGKSSFTTTSIATTSGTTTSGTTTSGSTTTGGSTTAGSSTSTSSSSSTSTTSTTTGATTTSASTTTIIPYIYCVGGSSGASGSKENLTYYATINSIGIGTWKATTPYPYSFSNPDGHSCSIYNNYIYCVGNGNVTAFNYSYYAPISSSGIGSWTNTTKYPINLSRGYYWEFDCSDYGGKIYCPLDYLGGGIQFNFSNYAPVSSSGIGTWAPTSGNVNVVGGGTSLAYNGYLYQVGTATAPFSQVWYAPIVGAGIGQWVSGTTYPNEFAYGSCVAYNSTMYCVGDYNVNYGSTKYENYTYYAPIMPNGALGAWTRSTDYPTPFFDGSCDAYGGSIFCIGGSGTTQQNRVYSAQLSGSGIGAWTAQPSLPALFVSGSCQTPASGGGFGTGGGYYNTGTTSSTTTVSGTYYNCNQCYYVPIAGYSCPSQCSYSTTTGCGYSGFQCVTPP